MPYFNKEEWELLLIMVGLSTVINHYNWSNGEKEKREPCVNWIIKRWQHLAGKNKQDKSQRPVQKKKNEEKGKEKNR